MKKLIILIIILTAFNSFAGTVAEWAGQPASGMSQWMGQDLP